jgi:hypothetical protein
MSKAWAKYSHFPVLVGNGAPKELWIMMVKPIFLGCRSGKNNHEHRASEDMDHHKLSHYLKEKVSTGGGRARQR